MFNALIYRKRMEQTEYLIHSTTIELDLHVFILIRRFSIKTVIIDLKVRCRSGELWFNILLISASLFVCFFSPLSCVTIHFSEETVNADKRMIKILCIQFHQTSYKASVPYHICAGLRQRNNDHL